MKQPTWLALLFLLAAGVALGEVYKWVDETGHVQFGDTPPPGSDAQPVQMHKVPTPEEVGRAKQRFDERLEQARLRRGQLRLVWQSQRGAARCVGGLAHQPGQAMARI